ncbi:MAG TPA: glycosyltransferase family 4 protein [Thermoleophilaceae bacterium]
MRVLVAHNRYRVEGGEERSVELQLRALTTAGIDHALYECRSSDAGRPAAAAALLRGGADPADLTAAAQALDADVVHVHNMQPLIGPRGLEAARATGARVILHLHNLRLFCAIGVASRDGKPCFRCHHRLTLPGAVLNCRGSLPESAAYATALSLHQPRVLAAVDRFVAPSRYAAGQLAALGLPAERITVLEHYLPAAAFAERSSASEGSYALVASRLSEEKGIDAAIEACAVAGVPLKIAGEGPQERELRAIAADAHGVRRAAIEFLGRVDRTRMTSLLAGAALVLMPSRYHEFSPYAALEAAAAGVPVVATRMGGLPELLGSACCVEPGDTAALAERVSDLWTNPAERSREGEALLARARDAHGDHRFVEALGRLYATVPGHRIG